ncbi:RNA polymerase subunit sigma-24 [Intrasporangium oryzae NRRL B-24470]|uniref:RNA polymerase subunit sigma-24 n=1 Tax=Intrasporangium oryzae NRRL B-24470 TaxID=1386089 RepID=W9G6G6_9MICO|nr:SigE family RNA polymerase sigma factor [Intrasporangium oryzae]EWT00902.1 RNA polymerase subunit sigma-24 [Intrasporangium oryzae NRRL B-24470]
MTTLPAEADQVIATLYAAHWDRLVRLAWLLLHDQLAAEDVVQDAYVATHRNWASIRESGRVLGYLQTAVVNGCRSVLRHRVVVDRHHTHEAASARALGRASHESAEAPALRSVERRMMIGALDALPGRQREVLVLRYYGDLSEAQIAHALGISPGSVKSHVHRGLNTLRAAMAAPDGGPDGHPAGQTGQRPDDARARSRPRPGTTPAATTSPEQP